MKGTALALGLLASGWAAAGRYTVQPGDTLYALAQRSGSSVAELQRLNTLSGSLIVAGQVLELPDGGEATPGAAARRSAAVQTGLAVWYVGQAPQPALTAAHLTLPLGSRVEVTHLGSGRTVVVTINDRGPFNGGGRIIDLSRAAAEALGIVDAGVARVSLRLMGER